MTGWTVLACRFLNPAVLRSVAIVSYVPQGRMRDPAFPGRDLMVEFEKVGGTDKASTPASTEYRCDEPMPVTIC